ncbi:MAG: hypothetical protein Q9202_004234 [Teloschistes flavicans]
MDPVSVTASVIAFIEAATKTVNYVIAVKNAPKEIKNLVEQLRGMRHDVEAYLALLSTTQASPDESTCSVLSEISQLADPQNPCSAFSICFNEVQALAKKFETIVDSKQPTAKAVLQALKWPFREKETHKLLADFVILRDRLQSALSVDHLIWKKQADGAIWLHGIPGAGKTILSTNVIQDLLFECKKDSCKALAYFYFTFNDPKKQTCEGMLRSLVQQLSSQSADSMKHGENLYRSYGEGSSQPTNLSLLKTLQDMVECFRTVYIVLDALDESASRPELSSTIQEIHSWHSGHICLLLVSRTEEDLLMKLEPLIPRENVIEIQGLLVNEDMSTYIRQRLSQDDHLRRWRRSPERIEEIESQLLHKADRMFRWVECQLDELRNCYSRQDLKDALQALPKDLNETYSRIICRIDEKHRRNTIKVLQWLVFSRQELALEEVLETMAINVDAEDAFDTDRRLEEGSDILRICPSLITITDRAYEHGKTIRLAHFTVEEFIMTDARFKGESTAREYAGIVIAEDCVGYLIQICNTVRTKYGFPETPDRPRLYTDFPLLDYACYNWQYHVRKAGEQHERLFLLVAKLFNRRTFRTLFNLLKGLSPGLAWDKPFGSLEIGPVPIIEAASQNLERLVKYLLEDGADVNEGAGQFGSALQAASSFSSESMVRKLLKAGAQVNAQGGYYGTALQAASGRYDNPLPIVQLLIDAGAEVNAKGVFFGNTIDAYFNTALQAASANGSLSVVKLLLRSGADIAIQSDSYGNALHIAARWCYHEMAEVLLKHGADVNLKGGIYGSPLQAALCGERCGGVMVRQLLEAGAEPKVDSRLRKRLEAAQNGKDHLTFEPGLDNPSSPYEVDA